MSAVIKLGSTQDASGIMPYAPDRRGTIAALAPPDRPPDPLREEVERLRHLLAEREAALEGFAEAVEQARAEGEKAGRIAAELEADDSRERALELLRKGIGHAHEILADCGDRLEVLALLIARTAIEKLFGDDRARKEAVGALALRQVQSVEGQMVVKVEVSRMDFPDVAELAELAAEIGITPDLLSASTELAAGACRMQLRLGTLEVGLDQQWGAIRQLLDDLASDAETPP